jgi:hypothetical protein
MNTDYMDIDDWASLGTRIKELVMQKKKVSNKIKKIQRSHVRVKLEKKRISLELKRLKEEWTALVQKDPAKAKVEFAKMVKSVSVEEMFPPDLEAEFNKIERDYLKGKQRTMKVVDLGDTDSFEKESAANALERNLEEDLKVTTTKTDADKIEEPDEELRMLIEPTNLDIGLSETDTFIDTNGNEFPG